MRTIFGMFLIIVIAVGFASVADAAKVLVAPDGDQNYECWISCVNSCVATCQDAICRNDCNNMCNDICPRTVSANVLETQQKAATTQKQTFKRQ